MAAQTRDERPCRLRGIAGHGLEIVTDLPDALDVSDAELTLLESYLLDIVARIVNEPE